jgi:hypothetical protein
MKDVIGPIIVGVFAIAGGFFAHLWSQSRDRENRREQTRRELYLDVVALILDDSKVIAETAQPRSMPTLEHQAKQHSIRHQLMLLAPKGVFDAYNSYHSEVFKQTTHPDLATRHFVTKTRDKLIREMRTDVGGNKDETGFQLET